ncbi:MAG: cytochrome P450/oxidoreductase [Pseudonocardia sp.]|nr:cytochrome P450/oxidoreductase [Pseudonocardia sp.]
MTADGCPVSARAAAFDPFGDDYQADPPASLRWSRDEEPVFYSPELGYWVVTRFDDVRAVFRDNALFSPSIALEKITPVCAEAVATLARHGYAMDRTLVNEDEPAHMPRRRALMGPFAPAELAHHEPMVRRLAREYVDRFVDRGEADLVDEMFWEVTLTVALEFLGVPEEDMPTLRKYSIAHTVNTWGRPSPDEQVAVADAVGKFWTYAGTVVEKIRKDPSGHGWMPYSIRKQQEQPDVVTDSYLHSMMMAGIVAAHETTANAAANALKLLLENRAVWTQICADPALISNAVEECLRHNGSVAAWRRLVTADTTIGGVPIPAGAKLLIVSSSANHDERHFDDPDAVDLRRENTADHLTFGFGSHQCLGKNLARMELQVFLEELTTRLPHLELVADQRITYLPNTSFRGPEHLRVRWDPAANPERRDPGVLDRRHPVRLGEPDRRAVTRAVIVDAVEREAADVVSVRLTSASGPLPAWSAGSHVDLEVGGVTRQYSLCGDPADREHYTIAVHLAPQSRGGSRFVHEALRPGHALRLRGPRNHFRLDPQTRRLVLVAGGIGITPILATADEARRRGLDYEIHYCGRTRDAMAFLDRLHRDHGDRLALHVGAEGARLDVGALFAAPRPDTRVHACGPARLIGAVETATRTWPDDALRVEYFSAAGGALDPEREHAFDVVLARSGRTVPVGAGETVLQALRAADVDVRSDCEEGLCGTCEVPVLGGEIDHRDLVLTRAERASGSRMTACCSRARGPSLLLDL